MSGTRSHVGRARQRRLDGAHGDARRRARALVLLAAGLVLAACRGGDAPARDAQRPSVLLVTIDTLRADHVHAYGYPRATTPHLDALAAEGVLFETAYAPSSATGPSHATLLTGRHPIEHGVVRNGIPLDAHVPRLATLLGVAGYRSAAFVSSYPVASPFGFADGFAHFDDAFPPGAGKLSSKRWEQAGGTESALDRRGAATVDRAEQWLAHDGDGGAPLFLWVHLFDPHAPYRPPAPYDDLFAVASGDHLARTIARYDGEIRYADEQLGRLVAAFERTAGARRSLVVVTSDHGEGLWDHGHPGHNRDVHEEQVRVPLVARWRDRLPGGARVTAPVHLVDVLPTLLAACGALPPPGLSGVDLLAAAAGETTLSPVRPMFLTRPYFGARRVKRTGQVGWGFAVRRGDWKLIVARDEQRESLFDLARDPHERTDHAGAHAALAADLAELVDTWQEAQRTARGDERPPLPREVRRRLRALGYVQ